VDLVIASSLNLKRKSDQLNPHSYFVPHAVNFDLFSMARSPETAVPPEIAQLPKPVIGYIGMFYPNLIDVDCVEYSARKSGYSFVFIGKKLGRFSLSRLERLDNVHFLGFKEPTELAGYLKGMDVCIMPRVKSELLEAVFPLKLFEYLAAGKPVVATKTDELCSYEHLISLANTPEEFLEAIDRELRDDTPEKITARVEAAKANTWDVRVEALSALVEKHLKEEKHSFHCNNG
jgi:glycosyltransferase involved in cell wall biosynthesis